MINSLRKRIIRISAISITMVCLIIFSAFTVIGVKQTNSSIDTFTDAISQNNGHLPNFDEERRKDPPEKGTPKDRFFTKEAAFTTRFFLAEFDGNGNVVNINTNFVSIDDEEANQLASKALKKGSERGWIQDYRYKLYDSETGTSVIFVDGTVNKNMTEMSLRNLVGILAASAFIIIFIIYVSSKKAVKPIAESYEKQKQFITDANHELKTPLTLIMANLDIIEQEIGENEWLNDIRTESENMTGLVNQLVELTRMDEENQRNMNSENLNLTEICEDIVSEFKVAADNKGIKLISGFDEDITFVGDEKLIRHLISIILDNAIKYCDFPGDIEFKLSKKRHINIVCENTCNDIDNVELERLTERFYRSDKARTSGSGYGIGLSLAKSITDMHKGSLTAYKAGSNRIGFKIKLS